MNFAEFKRIQSRRSFLRRLWWRSRNDCLVAFDGARRAYSARVESDGGQGPALPSESQEHHLLVDDGGPSHIDLYDPKPALRKWEGQALPESMTKDLRLAFIKPTAKVWASPRVFEKHVKAVTNFPTSCRT